MLAFLAARFAARRRALQAEVESCYLAARLCRTPPVCMPFVQQPSMAWTHGPRTQPRDGRGRLLSKAWLLRAETFTAADLTWFRHAPTHT